MRGLPKRPWRDVIKMGHGLKTNVETYPPEPLNYYVILHVSAFVDCVLLPIFDVNVSNATHKQLEFIFVEYFKEFFGN